MLFAALKSWKDHIQRVTCHRFQLSTIQVANLSCLKRNCRIRTNFLESQKYSWVAPVNKPNCFWYASVPLIFFSLLESIPPWFKKATIQNFLILGHTYLELMQEWSSLRSDSEKKWWECKVLAASAGMKVRCTQIKCICMRELPCRLQLAPPSLCKLFSAISKIHLKKQTNKKTKKKHAYRVLFLLVNNYKGTCL